MNYSPEQIEKMKDHIKGYESRLASLQNELSIHQNNVNYTQLLINNELLNINSLTGIIADYNIFQYPDTKPLFTNGLDSNEILTIIRNMDKTDYKLPSIRFIDINKIITDVVNIKKKYTNWKLINMNFIPDKSTGGNVALPKNKYMYVFVDDQNIPLSIGPL